MREYELFDPVRRLFEDNGYRVNAEVNNCDVVAIKDDRTVIVELKRYLTVELLSQGLIRQRLGSPVYICIPKPKKYSPRKFKPILDVIKKMELGLIFVTFMPEGLAYAEAVTDPEPYKGFSVNYKKKTALKNEIEGRTVNLNCGGISGKKIVTAYTEKCLYAAAALHLFGETSPAALKKLGADENIGAILRSNVYKWFYKASKGIYGISEEGLKALDDYNILTKHFESIIQKKHSALKN